jgi:hypothetical protein
MDAGDVLAEARSLGRPDLELRVLSALGSNAGRADLDDLRGRVDEAGDRFLLDVELHRITGNRSQEAVLRTRGLELYRKAPYAAYRGALAELGATALPTDVVVPPMVAQPDDPVYSRASVLEVIGSLREPA